MPALLVYAIGVAITSIGSAITHFWGIPGALIGGALMGLACTVCMISGSMDR